MIKKSKKSINYPKNLTFKKIWDIVQENNQRIQETLEKFEEKLEKLSAQYAAFEQEAKERQKDYEEERKVKEYHNVEIETEECDEASCEEDEEDELDQMFQDELARIRDKLGCRDFGEVPDFMLARHIERQFNKLGYYFSGIASGGFTIYDENEKFVTRVDLSLENEKTIIVVNIMSEPDIQEIQEHLKRMEFVRQDYKRLRYRDREVIGAVACNIFSDNVKQFAIESGLYFIVPNRNTVKFDVPDDFKPKIF
jgi:chromosome segregation ATPase